MHGVARRQPRLGPDNLTNWIRSALGRKSRAWNLVRRTAIQSLAGLLDKLMAWQAGRRSQSLKKKIALERARVRALLWKNPSLAAAPELMTEAHKFMMREGEWAVVARESMSSQSSRSTLARVVDDASIAESDSTLADARDAS